ncbi:hypothetical protein T10_7805 [Trichinella papuae]|uniref:Uncharacterized protein n=1 Tax=Trichinella papuae TaxID=268474 RepID=A0A0V1MKY2_9BILA|nr:hypothetical protein T10_7805 [Trichinella papuae]
MQGRENWPNEPAAIADDNEHLTAEQKTVKVLTSQTDESGVDQVINLTHYSRYETLIRVTAYCLRFARNCQSLASERTTDVNLSVKEIWNAERYNTPVPDYLHDGNGDIWLWIYICICITVSMFLPRALISNR